MATKKGTKIPADLLVWIEARKRHRLSDAQVQMARELGFNPKKLGRIDNHEQEPWKVPLPQFIESLYRERFKKSLPDNVLSIEQRAKQIQAKKELRKREKLISRNTKSDDSITDHDVESD